MNNSVKSSLKKKISVIDTLKSLPLNKEVTIRNDEIKSNVIRATSNKLKKEGYLFTVSERGRIDDVLVTRLK